MFECVKLRGKNIDRIRVRSMFTPPNSEKLIKKTAEFVKEGRLSPIYVDKYFNLLDGYCSYLIATTLGYKKAKIVQFRKREKPAIRKPQNNEGKCGMWIEQDHGLIFECSVCGNTTDYRLTKYCPECGARLYKGTEKEGET